MARHKWDISGRKQDAVCLVCGIRRRSYTLKATYLMLDGRLLRGKAPICKIETNGNK